MNRSETVSQDDCFSQNNYEKEDVMTKMTWETMLEVVWLKLIMEIKDMYHPAASRVSVNQVWVYTVPGLHSTGSTQYRSYTVPGLHSTGSTQYRVYTVLGLDCLSPEYLSFSLFLSPVH